jgi:hypothetical protein
LNYESYKSAYDATLADELLLSEELATLSKEHKSLENKISKVLSIYLELKQNYDYMVKKAKVVDIKTFKTIKAAVVDSLKIKESLEVQKHKNIASSMKTSSNLELVKVKLQNLKQIGSSFGKLYSFRTGK